MLRSNWKKRIQRLSRQVGNEEQEKRCDVKDPSTCDAINADRMSAHVIIEDLGGHYGLREVYRGGSEKDARLCRRPERRPDIEVC